jgi:hypothetical protein
MSTNIFSNPTPVCCNMQKIVPRPNTCEQVRFIPVLSSAGPKPLTATIEGVRQRMKITVNEHFDTLKAAVEFDVVHGPRLDRLLEHAVQHQHDLVILGHRRDRSGKRSLAQRTAP